MTFQVSDTKSTYFLKLLNSNLNIIEPTYTKEKSWINHFSFSNLLYARVTCTIINYIPIDEYWLRFFLRKNFACLCRIYLIKTRHYVLYECRRFVIYQVYLSGKYISIVILLFQLLLYKSILYDGYLSCNMSS